MTRNRFEQVNEVQPDAITLVLKRDNDGTTGSVVMPAAASGGRLSNDQVSAQLPAQDAFRGAIRLANDVKLAIVVWDPDGVWKSEWGELYQPSTDRIAGRNRHMLPRRMETSMVNGPPPRPSFRVRALMAALHGCNRLAGTANDSAAELSIGGLQFVRTNDVAMESEDLRIALDKISVRYQFANVTNKPVTLTVAFPLPDIDLSEADNIALPSNDPVNFVDFETKVDGSPAPLTIDQRAMIGDKDVSAQLRQFKLPLLPDWQPRDPGGRPARSDSDPARGRRTLMPAGMSDNGRQQYAPGWVTRTSAVRQQVFPPARTVIVEHQYRPSVGSSADTILRASLRRNSALGPEVARYRKEYCVTDRSSPSLISARRRPGPTARSCRSGGYHMCSRPARIGQVRSDRSS